MAELKENHQLENTCMMEKIFLLEKGQQGTSSALEGEYAVSRPPTGQTSGVRY